MITDYILYIRYFLAYIKSYSAGEDFHLYVIPAENL
jgi:hypothetical protein